MLATNFKNYLVKGSYIPFLIGLVSGIYFITLKIVGYHFEFFPGDYIDGRFNNYILEHGYQFFTGSISEFWNASFMYPEKEVISYSDNLLGTAPFYAIFRLFGFDRETAFQLWYLLITILNFTSAYLLIKFLFKNAYAASIGAMLFTFSLALQSQVGHAQTFSRFPMVLSILFALKFANAFELKWFFITVFTVVYQMYCGIYLGFLLLFPTGILIIAAFFYNWKVGLVKLRSIKYHIQIMLSLIINVLFLLPLIIPYLKRANELGYYNYKNIVTTIPTLLSYFSSWVGSLFWDGLKETTISYPAFWDHLLFAGGLGTIGVIIFLFLMPFFKSNNLNDSSNRLKFQLSLLWLTGVFTFLFFIRFENYSFFRLLYLFPGYGSMRALQRIINFELIFFSIGLAYLLVKILNKKSYLNFVLFLCLVSLMIADNFVKEGFIHHKSKMDSQWRILTLTEQMKNFPKDVIVSYEPDSLKSSPMDYQLDAMLAAQSLGLKTLNGYSATSPGGYGNFWVKPNEESRLIWLEKKELKSINLKVIH